MCAKESNVISKHIENKEVHLHHERHHLIHPERRTGGIQPGRCQALRQGFSLLAMGFTGKEAVQWKLKYIAAFNAMEKQLAAQHKEQRAVQDANIQNAIDRVIEARKKLDENTAFLDECRKNREDSKAKYMQVKALCGEFKAIYGQHCDTVRTMENVVRGSQSFLTNAIDSLTIVAKGYPFYAALMDSLLDGLPTEKKEK